MKNRKEKGWYSTSRLTLLGVVFGIGGGNTCVDPTDLFIDNVTVLMNILNKIVMNTNQI